MKTQWSVKWKSSTQPRKQRKYRYNAPYHIRGRFLNSHLSKELRKKYGKRAVRIRKGDSVKIVRGSFKGQSGKIERVNAKRNKVYISKIEVIKKDGTKRSIPIEPSNIVIQELNLDDKKRMKMLGAKPKEAPKPEEKKKEKSIQPSKVEKTKNKEQEVQKEKVQKKVKKVDKNG